MKRFVWAMSLFFFPMCAMDVDSEPGSSQYSLVSLGEAKIEADFDVTAALEVLHFCQQAKEKNAAPDGCLPGTLGVALQVVHLKEETQFEQVYGELATKLLMWAEQYLLQSEQDLDLEKAFNILGFCQKAKATESFPKKYVPKRVYGVDLSGALEVTHIKSSTRFERIYNALTKKMLDWTTQNLLSVEQKE